MRIIYLTINETISHTSGGVSNKLLIKVSAIKAQTGFCVLLNARLSGEHDEIIENIVNDVLIDVEIGVRSANKGYLNTQKKDASFYKKLANFIKNKDFQERRIIMRYPLASLGLLRFVQNFDKRVVFEHNTKEPEELKMQVAKKKYAPFSIRPSGFFFWLQEKKLPLHYEKKLAPKIFNHAHSGACVTTEIANFQKRRNHSYHTFVSSNFYNVSEAPLSTSFYNGNNQLLALGMIVSTTASWYGLDRLMKSFAPVQKHYKLIIAGIDQNNRDIKNLLNENKILTNIEFLGKVSKNELDSFYNKVHICFGSLGLYKLNLNYASTLKVKESLAYGVPVAIGYKEEDFLNHKDFSPYYVQLENTSSLIDFALIRQFCLNFYTDKMHKTKLKKLALQYMDVSVKVKALLQNIK